MTDRISAHAETLWKAAEAKEPVPPLTRGDAGLDVADAYAIQSANIERAIGTGRRVVGHKVGLTSKAMQDMLGVNEPDFGVLLDDMVVPSGSTIAFDRLLQPRVEAEIAVRLGTDLRGPGVTTESALAAIEVALPSLEIIDSRIADWKITLVDTVADNGSSAMAVLGEALPVGSLDLRLVGVVLERNGEPVEHGVGAAALGHPAACVAWLANKLAELGSGLEAGQVVLPGALHRAVPVQVGDTVRAEFDGLGSVSVSFS